MYKRQVHRAAIRLNDEAQLVAGCFSNIEAEIVQAGEELGIDTQRNYRTFEEMAEREGAREDKIDWVDIVTPNRFHYPAAKLFLQQGVSVVCEKPLCFTVEQLSLIHIFCSPRCRRSVGKRLWR